MKLTGMYTTAGEQMAARAVTEQKALIITRAAAGSGLTDRTAAAMVTEDQPLSLYPMTAENGHATLPALLMASSAKQDYPLREIGLFARLGSGPETLYKLFCMDEKLTIERTSDLTATFYLTESVLQPDQIEVTVDPYGLITQDQCDLIVRREAEALMDALSQHMSSGSAHAQQFAGKAPLSHTHSAGQITGGTLGGIVSANSNTGYLTPQLHNIVLGTTDPQGGSNGQLWVKYLP